MAEKFSFMCKTFRRDAVCLHRLIDSYEKYNADHIKMFLVWPIEDNAFFSDLLEKPGIEYVPEEKWGRLSENLSQPAH